MEVQISIVTYDELRACIGDNINDHYESASWWDLGLDMDDDLYRLAEANDSARFYMATVSGFVVGYVSLLAAPMMQHKGVMQAVTESFYVIPEYRKHGVFSDLLAYIERDCTDCGIKYLTVAFPKTEKGVLDRFVKMAGYKDSEVSFTKEL